MHVASGILVMVIAVGLWSAAAQGADDPKALNAEGTAKFQAGDHAGGIALVEKAVTLAEGTSGAASDAADAYRFNLGLMRATDGDIKAAAPLFDMVTAHLAQRHGDQSLQLADTYFKIGTVLVTRDPPAASEALDKAVAAYGAMAEASPPVKSENYIRALTQSGSALARQGKLENARQALEAAVDKSEHLFGKKASIAGEAHFALASFLQATYQYKGAIKEFQEAADAFEPGLPGTLPLFKEASLTLIGLEAPKQAIARAKALSKLVPDEVVPPVMIKRGKPMYPRSALSSGIQGCAKFVLTVAKDGTVKDIKITGGQHADEFGQAAIIAARKSKYAPALLNGQPVEDEVESSMSFALAAAGDNPKFKRCE